MSGRTEDGNNADNATVNFLDAFVIRIGGAGSKPRMLLPIKRGKPFEGLVALEVCLCANDVSVEFYYTRYYF